jgi:hypothetical protein
MAGMPSLKRAARVQNWEAPEEKQMAEKRDALSRQGRRFLEVSTVSLHYFCRALLLRNLNTTL